MLARGDGPAAIPPLTVTFFLAEAGDAGLDRLDPDRDWRELQVGERAWILQSYLRLAAAGLPVALAEAPRPGIVVYHAKQWRELERRLTVPQQSTLVAVRGDVRPAPNADFEVVQNPRVARGRRLFVPHWPQAGLVPRDAARGSALRCAAYKGVHANLHPELQRPEWRAALAGLGVEWVADEVDHRAGRQERAALRWPDYSTVDVVVALRPPDRRLHPGKPATKLYNAWLAGVPAALGPESAYRAERRSPLDYLEAATAAEALAALARLAGDPGHYQAMVTHGRARAAEVSPEATTERWRQLLFEVLPEQIRGREFRRYRRLPRRSRTLAGRVRRLLGNR
jgi:hypothetical protein